MIVNIIFNITHKKCEQKKISADENRVLNNNNFFVNDKERRERSRGSTSGSHGIAMTHLFVISIKQKAHVCLLKLSGKFLFVERKDVIKLSEE